MTPNGTYSSPTATLLQKYRTKLLLQIALENGLSLSDCLKNTSLRATDLDRDSLIFSMKDQIKIIANVGKGLPDQDIGLQMGCRIGLFSRDRIGMLLASMPTFRDAIETAERYQYLLQVPMVGHLTIKKDIANLTFEYTNPVDSDSPGIRLHTESVVASIITSTTQLIGRPLTLIECNFSHNTPSYQESYHRIFDCKISFGHLTTQLIFPATELNAHSLFCHQIYRKDYESSVESEFLSLQKSSCIADQVRQQLHYLPNKKSDLNQVASQIGLTQRTLRRRLKEEGLSFRSLKEDYLLKKAEELLTESSLNIEAVALQLGYSDASNFRRALRRWKGQSPDEIRKLALLSSD